MLICHLQIFDEVSVKVFGPLFKPSYLFFSSRVLVFFVYLNASPLSEMSFANEFSSSLWLVSSASWQYLL
jgi:hypothetical protein